MNQHHVEKSLSHYKSTVFILVVRSTISCALTAQKILMNTMLINSLSKIYYISKFQLFLAQGKYIRVRRTRRTTEQNALTL